MFLKKSLRLYTIQRSLKPTRLPQFSLSQYPLRFYNKPSSAADSKPTEKKELDMDEELEKKMKQEFDELNQDHERPVHKVNSLKGDGHLEGEMYEKVYKYFTLNIYLTLLFRCIKANLKPNLSQKVMRIKNQMKKGREKNNKR